jgi:hypothetical protein
MLQACLIAPNTSRSLGSLDLPMPCSSIVTSSGHERVPHRPGQVVGKWEVGSKRVPLVRQLLTVGTNESLSGGVTIEKDQCIGHDGIRAGISNFRFAEKFGSYQ